MPMMPAWIKSSERKPPIGATVRVAWIPASPTDRKTALWDGLYWWSARKSGIYDEAPAYWLDEPPIPPAPAD